MFIRYNNNNNASVMYIQERAKTIWRGLMGVGGAAADPSNPRHERTRRPPAIPADPKT